MQVTHSLHVVKDKKPTILLVKPTHKAGYDDAVSKSWCACAVYQVETDDKASDLRDYCGFVVRWYQGCMVIFRRWYLIHIQVCILLRGLTLPYTGYAPDCNSRRPLGVALR